MNINPKFIRLAHRVLKAEIALAKIAAEKDQTFEEAIKDQKFKHPDTGNDVVFKSLPDEEQKKIRAEFDKANPSEKELSKEDKEALEELSILDLDSDEFMALFEGVLEEMNLSDPPDLSELKDMDKDELEDQAESLLKNYDEGLDALQKSLQDMSDELGDKKEDKKEEKKEEKKEYSEEERDQQFRDHNNAFNKIDKSFDENYTKLQDALDDFGADLAPKTKEKVTSILEMSKAIEDEKMKAYEDQYAADVEKYGKERAEELWDDWGAPDTWDDEAKDEILELPDLSGVEKELKKIEDKEKAEKAKKDKEKAEKKKMEDYKKQKAEKDKSKEGVREKAKDKSYRDEAKKKSLEGLDAIVEDISDSDGYYEGALRVGEAFEDLYSSYGIEPGDDLGSLDDDVLEDFVASVIEIDNALTEKMNAQRKKLDDDRATAKESLKENKAKLKEMNSKLKKFEKMTAKQWSDLEDNDPEKFEEMTNEWSKLDEEYGELVDANEEYEEKISFADRGQIDSAIFRYEDDDEYGVNNMLAQAQGLLGNRKEQKKIEEAQKKEEEEHKQKVKDYTKKINDLISNAESADNSKSVTDLFGEFGRMKGQLSGGKVFDEVKGDLDKAEKALNEAQSRNSFAGKMKSFFKGKGKKKASKAQRDKVAKLALELLQEEIALYKEEEARKR